MICTERCRSCYYSTAFARDTRAHTISCDYILVERKKRGCPAGDSCDKYRPGKRNPMGEAIFAEMEWR